MSITSDALILDAETAADLMTPNPVVIRPGMGLEEALDLLAEKDLSALPVLDAAGRPVGVLSRTDIVRYFRVSIKKDRPTSAAASEGPAAMPNVRDLMAPAVLSVSPETPALEVVAQLLGLGNVHRLYVIDAGALVGVVTDRDVLRRLRRRADW
jgi:CBS domain-containing protein